MIAGSENRLNRNGSTAAAESGPPRFISTMASLAMGADQFAEPSDMIGRRLGYHAMAEIENERSAAERIENALDRISKDLAAGDQQLRIEIPLNGSDRLQLPRLVERGLGVNA